MAVDRRPKFLAFAVCLTASSMVSSPQLNKLPISDAPYPLDTVKVLSCVFPVSVETAWQNGEPRPEIAHRGDALALTFDQIDAQGGSARMSGGAFGPADIVAQLAGNSLHFLESSPTGSLSVTTVFGRRSPDGKLAAVYTRTEYLPTNMAGVVREPAVSQHYGSCDVK